MSKSIKPSAKGGNSTYGRTTADELESSGTAQAGEGVTAGGSGTPEHVRLALEDIAKRGLPLEIVKHAGIEPVADVRPIVGGEARPGMVIPYYDIHGRPLVHTANGLEKHVLRVRLLGESNVGGFVEKKKPLRYRQPGGVPPYAYFARCGDMDWPVIQSNLEIPILVTEGEFKALYACMCGFRTIGLGGVDNIVRDGELIAELVDFMGRGRHVFVVFDSDAATNPNVVAAERRFVAEAVKRGSIPHVARLPSAGSIKVGMDDYLLVHGPDALEKLLAATPAADSGLSLVVAGTDVEIADAVLVDVTDKHRSDVVFCEGDFHAYDVTHWRALPDEKIRNAVFRYDRHKVGTKGIVKLSKARTDSIVSIMRDRATLQGFFTDAPSGINCASGFLTFDGDGNPSLEPHNRKHRQRHCLPGSWAPEAPPQDAPLLGKLLQGCFGEDPDCEGKIALMQEVCGAAALGLTTKLTEPKAIVLYGPRAGNGKSEMLALLRGLLPEGAACTIAPTRFDDEKMVASLAGKLLNACDELGTARAIADDVFKAAVTGNSVRGRGIYKNPVDFRPVATHTYATNRLPSFSGGIDNGVQRRILVVPLNRIIPKTERIPEIGQLITTREPDALLAFAVEGARRVIRNGRFTEPASCRSATREWISSADPVLAWFADEADLDEGHRETTAGVYANFTEWAKREGIRPDRIPASNTFFNRLYATTGQLGNIRSSNGVRFVVGLKLKIGRSWPHREFLSSTEVKSVSETEVVTPKIAPGGPQTLALPQVPQRGGIK